MKLTRNSRDKHKHFRLLHFPLFLVTSIQNAAAVIVWTDILQKTCRIVGVKNFLFVFFMLLPVVLAQSRFD